MNITEYLDIVAYIDLEEIVVGEKSEVYKSKFDGSYITHVGLEDDLKFLADRGITEQLTHGVGFSPKDNKWYGWSHRAIYGFGIGSECKKGDCHYVGSTPEELIDDYADFFADISQECADGHREECQILPDRSGIRILHSPIPTKIVENISDLTEALDGDVSDLPDYQLFRDDYTVVKCGKGEWIAKTMEDAKQMAIDFNNGVS